MSADPAVVVTGLTKRFGRVTAVRDLSFTVATGKVTGFLGPNGSGKSTTLRTIVGMIRPNEGQATVFGRRYADLPHPSREVGAVLDVGNAHPRRTARNHLRVLALGAGVPVRRVEEVLATVGLADAADRRSGGFSLGMRQRLSLAGALLAEPRLLLLDEPANGLDPAGMRWLRTTLRNFVSTGGTVLLSSHALAEVAQTADEVVIISQGSLVSQRRLTDLTSGRTRVRIRTPQRNEFLDILRSAGLAGTTGVDDELFVEGATARDVGQLAAQHHVVLYEIAEETSSLEDVFLNLTTNQSGAVDVQSAAR
jgi:ABC-2 type transport system ATP-binding protein